ncbi:MAG: sigma-54-dependent Fis family transcriptional regulator [Deltaproteobacteria bacterium]|nr:sigma-54-dependent Fis family transcriptional regulator [Deltaproteobacteria bacterium]
MDQLTPHVLVVDDEEIICQQLQRLYAYSGYTVEVAHSGEAALERLEKRDIDLVVTDVRLPGISGVDLTVEIQKNYPDVPVIVITGHAAIDCAVEVLKRGASDFIVKPFAAEAIQESTKAALEKARVFIEIRQLRRTLKGGDEFGGMLSRTPEMHRVFETIRMVAPTDMTVLVEGETGTGKELVASAIHYHSPRRDGPFATINCGGFPDTLLESELFGYEQGAFTGAERARAGKIELAHGGTLFLDEIESMSLLMQSKLLRVLEDQKVQRLGGDRPIQVDMRVIAASNVPLEALISQGKMRSDFYYRINVIPIRLLPLRDRREDIPLLVDDFLRHHRVAIQKGITGMSRGPMSRLTQYHWPGNIRELQNILEKAVVMTTGAVIEKIEIPILSPMAADRGAPDPSANTLNEWLMEQEKQYLIQQLGSYQGKIALTAKNLGLGIRTLTRKMRLYGLQKKDFRPRADQNAQSENEGPSNNQVARPRHPRTS